MSTKTLAIRSVFSNWVGRACAIVITFFLTPFVVHTLGDESYGIWAILMSFTSYYALADMGVRAAAVKYISQYVGKDDRESTSKIVITTLSVYLFIATCLSLIVLIVAWLFPYAIELSEATTSTVRWVILLSGGAVAVQFFGQVFSATLHAYQRFDLTNVVSISSQLIKALAYVAVLNAGFGLVGMAVVTLAATVIAQFCLATFAIRLLGGLPFSKRYFDREMLKLVFSFAGKSFLTNTARRITQYFGTIIIGMMYGPAAVAFYAIPESLSRHALSFAKGVTSVIDPLASRLESQGQQKSLVKLLIMAPRCLLAYSLAVAALFVTHGKQFVGFWIGPEYAIQSYPILCVLAIALVARVTSNPLRSLLRGMAKLDILVICAILEMAITLVAGPCLAYQFGLVGMAWAIAVAQVCIGGIILPVYCCRVLEFPGKEFFRDVVRQPVLSVLSSLTVGVLLVWLVPATGLYLHMLQMACVAAVGAFATFLFCFDREQKQDVVGAISKKFARKPVASS